MQPRILFIQPNICGIGGIERVVPTVAQSLKERGYEVSAISLYDVVDCNPGLWSSWSSLFEPATRNWMHRLAKSIKRVNKLVLLIRHAQPSLVVVSAQGTSLMIMALKALGVLRVPVCVYVHQSLRETDSFYGPVSIPLYRFADGILCVSEGLASEVRDLVGTRVAVVRVYNPVPPVRERTHVDSVGIFKNYPRPYFMTASRLEYIKGVDLLIKGFARYAEQGKGTLFVLGDGSQREALERQVTAAGLGERIRFLGVQMSPRGLLSKADLYLSLARSEAFGVALVEALAEGVPVVVADAAYGPREILSVKATSRSYPVETPYGYLLDTSENDESAASFVTALRSALDHPERFPKETLRARAAEFNTENVIGPLVGLVERLVCV